MASYYDDAPAEGQYGGPRGGGGGGGGGGRPGITRRRPRPVTDYGSSLVQYLQTRRPRFKGSHRMESERPSASYVVDMVPPAARPNSPADSIPVRHLHTSLGKSKKPVTVVRWMPEGRRLLAGVHNGEFMLWNGMAFNFETVMTASVNYSIRAAEWSNGKDWLLSADDEGTVKYWQTNFNNVNDFRAHEMPVRDLSFSPTDVKFVTASDDSSLKIFDFSTSTCESTLEGHSWDTKSCDWHPSKGLIVSGSKDHSVKLWDPRTSRNLTTLHNHKNALTVTVFSRLRDQLLATAGRDNLARVFDLRMMRDVCILRGHEKGITALTWHPIHASMISTGGDDGALHTYLLDEPNPPPGTAPSISPYNTPDPPAGPAQSIFPAHRISYAHESSIWSLDWHPLGHILATGSNDHFTRFWSRPRPGETNCFKDQFHLGEEGAEAQGTYSRNYGKRKMREQEEQELEDEAEGLVDQKMPARGQGFSIPGLPLLPHPNDGTSQGGAQSIIPGMGTALPPPPPPSNLNLTGLNDAGGPAIDPTRLASLFASGALPPPGQIPPPPPPGSLPADFDISRFLPTGFQPPPPPPPASSQQHTNGIGGGGAGIPGLGGGGGMMSASSAAAAPPSTASGSGGGSIRQRAPLPSQKESLRAEQRMGKYRHAK